MAKKFLWIQNLEPSNKLSGTRSCTGTRVRPCKFITLCRECVWCKMSFFIINQILSARGKKNL